MTEPEFEPRQSGSRATLLGLMAALANGVWKVYVISTSPLESVLSCLGIWNQREHNRVGIKIEYWSLEGFSKCLLMGSKEVGYSMITERGLRFDRQSSFILLSNIVWTLHYLIKWLFEDSVEWQPKWNKLIFIKNLAWRMGGGKLLPGWP